MVSVNTWHVTCFGFLVDLFSFFILGIALRHRSNTDFDDLYVTWRILAHGFAFWGPVVATLYLGDQIPQKQFWGMNIGFFKPNAQNTETCIISKILHCIDSNQICTTVKTITCSSWVVQSTQQIQDGGRPPFGKPLNCHISATVRPIFIKYGTMTQIGPLQEIDR